MSKAVATREQEQHPVVQAIRPKMPNMARLLPTDIELEQFRAALFLELSTRYGLIDCLPDTVATCAIKAATYGMLPGRDCHFLPFRDKRRKGKAATFVPNYFGVIRMLERTGKLRKAFAHAVYENDDFSVDYLSDAFHHRPAKMFGKKPGKVLCYYGCIILKDGTRHVEVMSKEDIDAVKAVSPAHEEGPWVNNYEQMARKTCIKRVAKYVQLTPEIRELIEDDDQRLLTDVPSERAQQNIEDMYGPEYKPPYIPDMTQSENTPESAQDASESKNTDEMASDTAEPQEKASETKIDNVQKKELLTDLDDLCHDVGNALGSEAVRKRPGYKHWCKTLDQARAAIANKVNDEALLDYRGKLADILDAVREGEMKEQETML